jgi:hypothetical protein
MIVGASYREAKAPFGRGFLGEQKCCAATKYACNELTSMYSGDIAVQQSLRGDWHELTQ